MMEPLNFDMHDPQVALSDILAILPPYVSTTRWVVEPRREPDGEEYFDVASDGDDPMSLALEAGRKFRNNEFASAAKQTPQIIWGTFKGYDPQRGTEPWLTLSAIDSAVFEVVTEDPEVRWRVRARFKNVREGRW